MQNQQYVTITHYKEREFYFLNYAIQTKDGFIPKEIEQFHESEKNQFIDRIYTLQSKYPKNQIISLSLSENQIVKDREEANQVCAKIFNSNYVMQEKIDVGTIPVTLYFSPFSILYEEYKHKLNDKLTLMIGLFDRKLYIMFVTEDKIHQSWTLGTRGLTEKQVAERVNKSMKAYYKISYKFADNIKMLVADDSPKLLKVLREELSVNILPTQKTIHNILHNMGSEQSKFNSSYIKTFLSSPLKDVSPLDQSELSALLPSNESKENHSLNDIRLNNSKIDGNNALINNSFLDKIKRLFAVVPLLLVLSIGGYFTVLNNNIEEKIIFADKRLNIQENNINLVTKSEEIFSSMGKSAELKNATISTKSVKVKGIVWGIEPLRNSLNKLYNEGEFIIKPLENFMTEFSFKSKP